MPIIAAKLFWFRKLENWNICEWRDHPTTDAKQLREGDVMNKNFQDTDDQGNIQKPRTTFVSPAAFTNGRRHNDADVHPVRVIEMKWSATKRRPANT